ncbi:hypothetical protein COT78_02850 [Candidatus Berkelbacteria bacterium CG10_big_fil_rev_8_21_14_0_10_43_13]|uniref:Uncharacterized protein n=1 Tax=Candidatus Berkelbacteria bacterium CG10_big_fil_rev_8_21_14_0_10_43_13 TaxID=1974514 RepID=A0A2H0W6A7_9BACT|nr:MAG: hypothetical protein COT78_02850 [Candidatus Berkelbacteria bacterium CG10_big_fil_rev_8_21_14_0_10_43_13]
MYSFAIALTKGVEMSDTGSDRFGDESDPLDEGKLAVYFGDLIPEASPAAMTITSLANEILRLLELHDGANLGAFFTRVQTQDDLRVLKYALESVVEVLSAKIKTTDDPEVMRVSATTLAKLSGGLVDISYMASSARLMDNTLISGLGELLQSLDGDG